MIWLRNANCINTLNPSFDNDGEAGDGQVTWQHALDFVAGINAGTYNCGDTSNGGVHQTDWRLPNIRELYSLVDHRAAFPALPAGHPFMNFASTDYAYWSSTTNEFDKADAWFVNFMDGDVSDADKANAGTILVTAVRGGL